jgi:hypothetical protein
MRKFVVTIAAFTAALAAGSLAMGTSGAQAAVSTPAAVATAAVPNDVTPVRWVCGPLRCVWRPGYPGRPHAWATGWAPPRHDKCVWERKRGGPWVEVCG